MILQPLFENTMKYVIAGTIDGGRIYLTAIVSEGQLRITIEDTGHPDQSNIDELLSTLKKGVGLQNTEDRLTMHYKEEGRMILNASEHGGVKIDLIMPFQTFDKTERVV